jgi:hypothetical protein
MQGVCLQAINTLPNPYNREMALGFPPRPLELRFIPSLQVYLYRYLDIAGAYKV